MSSLCDRTYCRTYCRTPTVLTQNFWVETFWQSLFNKSPNSNEFQRILLGKFDQQVASNCQTCQTNWPAFDSERSHSLLFKKMLMSEFVQVDGAQMPIRNAWICWKKSSRPRRETFSNTVFWMSVPLYWNFSDSSLPFLADRSPDLSFDRSSSPSSIRSSTVDQTAALVRLSAGALFASRPFGAYRSLDEYCRWNRLFSCAVSRLYLVKCSLLKQYFPYTSGFRSLLRFTSSPGICIEMHWSYSPRLVKVPSIMPRGKKPVESITKREWFREEIK